MSDRFDELKGNVKHGAGKVTGDTQLQAEGETQRDTARARRQVKGAANQVKGNVEEGFGKVTEDETTRAQGMADRLKGESQQRG